MHYKFIQLNSSTSIGVLSVFSVQRVLLLLSTLTVKGVADKCTLPKVLIKIGLNLKSPLWENAYKCKLKIQIEVSEK